MSRAMPALALLLALASSAAAQPPGQPFASYWFPEELMSWTPESDPDAPFNRSWVELADRSWSDTQCNAHARQGEGGITAVSIMYPSTSGNPSQGGCDIDVYAFGYWQYIDLLVFWSGSAGEGLILAPSADVIDAAHRNGVPAYGTVFFVPTEYGGQIGWVWGLVQEEGGTYPVADKLIEVAEHYGFEGWFINQETAGGTADLAEAMRDMMLYVQEDTVSPSMFLNFWWSSGGLSSSADYAEGLGRSPYELYAGADVQAGGYNTSVNWDGVFPEGEPHTISLAFYCPNWTYSSSSGHQDFYERANRFWVGPNRDPGDTSTPDDWKGLTHYVPARTPLTQAPFRTCFNTGQGYGWWVGGEQSRDGEWNNRSLQDVQPTYRWIADSDGDPLYPEIEFGTAWEGGSCLKVGGDLSAGVSTTLYLYKADLELSGDESLRLVYDTGGGAGDHSMIRVGLGLLGSGDELEYIDVGEASGEGWSEAVLPLSAWSGQTLSLLALEFESDQQISGFQQIDDNNETLRLSWEHSADPVRRYNVHQLDGDSSLAWLGATPGDAFFATQVTRPEGQTTGTVLLEALSEEGDRSDTLSAVFEWTVTGVVSHGRPAADPILGPVSPNPVAASVTIAFSLQRAGSLIVGVYSPNGRLVDTLADDLMPAGPGTLQWDRGSLPAGVYHLVMRSGGERMTRRCVLL